MTTDYSQQLDILRELRKENNLTYENMAQLCGLKGKQRRISAGNWEKGLSIPSPTRRHRFMRYLWDHLLLRKDPARFEEVWDILVMAWGWDPISDNEWSTLTNLPRPPRATEIDQRLDELAATLEQLQNGNVAAANRPSAADSVVLLPLTELPNLAPLPKGSRMPLARNPHFVGRHQELLELAHAFTSSSTTAISQVETAAATGLGGIGKTQLATEFVHRYGQFFGGGVYWLSFDNANTISSEVAACGGAGAMELRADFAAQSLEDQVRLVQAAWQLPTPRLLIFDNCEEPELLTQWRPTTGGCRVLVTSRCLEWDLAMGVHVHALDVLSREESVQLLQKHQLNADRAVLESIAAELGDLPLALHLAGSYLYRYRRVLTAEQYLAYLRNPELLTHPSLQGAGISPTGHVQHVARTFAISYERLDAGYELDARARQILIHMALLAPGEPVSYDLLADTLNSDLDDQQQAMAMDAAIMRLSELGLVDVQDSRQVRMHRLVASFVRISAPELWQAAQMQVEAVIQAKLDEYYKSVKPLPLLPIQLHLRHVVENALVRGDAESATLSHALARYLWGLGEFADALLFAQQGLAIRKKVWGEVHEATAISHHLIGILLQERNDFQQAHWHLQRSLNIRLKTVGENHYDTANTLVNIGELLWSEQRLSEAITSLERALVICDEAVDEDDPLVAEITMTLGMCLLDWGKDVERARFYMQEAIRIRESKLGVEHPYTALAYTNLGFLLSEMGRLDEAGFYYEKGLVIRRQTLGEKHIDTSNSLYCVGKLRRLQSLWDDALHYLIQALANFLDILGLKHAQTAACLKELGATFLGQKNIESARRYLEQALSLREELYPPNHLYLGDTFYLLGQVAYYLHDIPLAEQYYKRCLAIYQCHYAEGNFYLQQVSSALNRLSDDTSVA